MTIRRDKLKVLVATDIAALEEELILSEEHEIKTTSQEEYNYLLDKLAYIEEIIEREKFEVAVINRYLDPSDNADELIGMFRRLRKKIHHCRLIFILVEYDERVIFPLVNAGIFDLIIDENISKTTVLEAINNPAKDFDFSLYQETEEASKINLQLPSFKTKEKWKSKKVITTYSPLSKGASEIAIAITRALSKKSDKVCLVDFDYLRPTIKEKLSIKSDVGLYEVLQLARQDNLSAQTILSTLSDKENFKVLTGLYELNEIYHLNEEYLTRIVEVLQSNFEFLVIDVHSYYDLIADYVAFDKSDIIYAITSGDRQALERTMTYIDMFNKYEDVKPGSIKTIINNYGGFDLTSVEIEDIVKSDVFYVPSIKEGLLKRKGKKAYEKSIDELISVL